MKFSRLAPALGIAALLTACATDSAQMRTFKIAGGLAVDLPLTREGAPKAVENDHFRIEVSGFMLDEANRELIYTFAFLAKKPGHPRSVRVEDVTGTNPEVLVLDTAPEIAPNGYWQGSSFPRRKGDSSLGWVTDTGDTYKVFRFSITTADGRPFIIHQASVWPGNTKPLIREVLDGPAPRKLDAADR